MLFSLFVHKINFLFPSSSLLRSNIACAVVPEPAKKSRIIPSFLNLEILQRYFIKDVGLGKSKDTFSSLSSLPASEFKEPSMILPGTTLLSSSFFRYCLVKTFHFDWRP